MILDVMTWSGRSWATLPPGVYNAYSIYNGIYVAIRRFFKSANENCPLGEVANDDVDTA